MTTTYALLIATSMCGPKFEADVKQVHKHLARPPGHFRPAIASWYDEGSQTASGERFNPDGLTFAHRTMRFGTRVRFRNPRTGAEVIARCNDKGPARWTHREFDVSRGTARALGILGPEQPGSIRLLVEVLP